MAYNQRQVPFWDFVRNFQQEGEGVDHPAAGFTPFGPPGAHPFGAGFPFGGPRPAGPPMPEGTAQHPFGAGFPFGGWGQGPHHGPGGWGWEGRAGRRGRHGRRHEENDEHSPSRSPSPSGEKTEEEGGEGPSGEEKGKGRHEHGHRHGHHGPRRGPFGGCGRGGWGEGVGRREGWGGRGGWGGRRGPRGGSGGPGEIDFTALFERLSTHPLAQAFRTYAEAHRSGEKVAPEDTDAENTFVPPVDIFSTEKAFVLHVSLPGAKKEDVGVNWDADKGLLNLAGVVYRHGDEEFLKTLSKSERKVGVFDRSIKLPPADQEKEEIDGDEITAKLEDGVLIVTVPKVEKEWTEIKKVDVE